ncbi:hypothetical protein [Aquisphaera insulae]|uniref:hypothetical protein n=1 Tax=Aquisphaera insulae TaxID=2712864 RepID=UPI0013EB12EB|nr:hypothetical protein [Aquisphaera insulae]
MARPPTDLHRKVREILGHSHAPLDVAGIPIAHFEETAGAILAMLEYTDEHVVRGGVYQGVWSKHLAVLRRMALASLVEAFERFLKEIAVLCVDCLAGLVDDDRFDEFRARGGQIAFHMPSSSIGRTLCESDTWLDNKVTNERFKKLLKLPFGDNWENLLPEGNQQPRGEADRARTLAILWQIRHTIVHNVGFMTGSDAARLRTMTRSKIDIQHVLSPTRLDLIYVGRFLSETAHSVNRRVGSRLAEILTALHLENPALFNATKKAGDLSGALGFQVTVNGAAGIP